jgi:alkanesulfonate monooxygenase SsuD/methylene tetrahydromethanopterin reductase-like flavin-dependent oxidoreductase (luciferase family)
MASTRPEPDDGEAMRFGIGVFSSGPASGILRLVQAADEAGFDCLWLADSHLIMREAFVLLGAIATVTRRIEIGPGVTYPKVRHPSVIASAMTTLRELAPGRVHLGLGIGASGPANMGERPSSLRELEDTIGFVRELLDGQEATRNGKGMRLAFAAAPRLPIYVAASSERTHRMTGRLGDGAIIQGPIDQFRTTVAAIREEERGAGRREGAVQTVLWTASCLDDDEETAREAVRPMVARNAMVWLSRAERLGTIDEVDREPLRRLQREYDFARHMGRHLAPLTEDRWIERFSFCGRPDHVRRCCEQAFAAGADQVALTFYGADPEAQLRRFARQVIEPLRR